MKKRPNYDNSGREYNKLCKQQAWSKAQLDGVDDPTTIDLLTTMFKWGITKLRVEFNDGSFLKIDL